DLCDPVLDVALALALAHLERLLRDRLVREDPDPDLAAALHVAGHRPPRGLDLARRELPAGNGLEAIVAEAHGVAAGREARIPALELLSEFRSLRLPHGSPSTPRRQACACARGASAASCFGSPKSKTSPRKIQTFTPITPYVVRASANP